jgi:polyphosphate kinase
LKFVAICSSNLDEFFQVRISALKDQVAAGVTSLFTGGLTPNQTLSAIAPDVEAFVIEQEKLLLDVLVPELAARGVQLVSWEDLGDDDKSYLSDIFDQRIFPVLTPLAVDPGAPLPVHLEPGAQPGRHGQRSRHR